MRLFILPLALVAFAAPAAAQLSINGTRQALAAERERGSPVRVGGWQGELGTIDRRTEEARENGEITRREARSVRRQVGLVRSAGSSFALHGFTDAELDMLEAQTFALRDMYQAPSRPVAQRRGGR